MIRTNPCWFPLSADMTSGMEWRGGNFVRKFATWKAVSLITRTLWRACSSPVGVPRYEMFGFEKCGTRGQHLLWKLYDITVRQLPRWLQNPWPYGNPSTTDWSTLVPGS